MALGIFELFEVRTVQMVIMSNTKYIKKVPELQSQNTYLSSFPFTILNPPRVIHHIPNQRNGSHFMKKSYSFDLTEIFLYKLL